MNMTNSYTTSQTSTFTVTHARHLAAKVATDLKRIQRFYGRPNDKEIADYELEATLLLKAGLLGKVTYGFQRDGVWIPPMVEYRAINLVDLTTADDEPGRIPVGENVQGAYFTSYLIYSDSWQQLTEQQRQAFKASLPIKRSGADEPGVQGNLVGDRSYSAGGRALNRSSLRSY